MNVGESIWDKLTRVVLALLVVAAGLAICLWYRPVVDENRQLRRQKLELERRLQEQVEVSRKLQASLRAMEDPRTIERLARERLSYAKPGESVIHFDPPAATNGFGR